MKTFRTDSGYLLRMDSNQVRILMEELRVNSVRELKDKGYAELKEKD